jgi:hypothetical protein
MNMTPQAKVASHARPALETVVEAVGLNDDYLPCFDADDIAVERIADDRDTLDLDGDAQTVTIDGETEHCIPDDKAAAFVVAYLKRRLHRIPCLHTREAVAHAVGYLTGEPCGF